MTRDGLQFGRRGGWFSYPAAALSGLPRRRGRRRVRGGSPSAGGSRRGVGLRILVAAAQCWPRHLGPVAVLVLACGRDLVLSDKFRVRSEEHTSELQVTWPSRMPSSA